MATGKLHPMALGITFGVMSGVPVFFMGLLAYLILNGKPLASMFGTMYITYTPTFINAVLGGIIAFVNAAIAGYIAAWIYNFLVKHFSAQ